MELFWFLHEAETPLQTNKYSRIPIEFPTENSSFAQRQSQL